MAADEPPELQPTDSFEWARTIDFLDFETAAAVTKLSKKHRPAARTIAGIAYRLALWADHDGSNLRPSVARVAVTCRVDPKTAQTVMAILRELGLLEMVSHGNHRKTTEYRLTTPADLHERVRVLTPTEIEERMAALSGRRASSNGGMHTAAEPSARGGCTPQQNEWMHDSNGGMPATSTTATGCGTTLRADLVDEAGSQRHMHWLSTSA